MKPSRALVALRMLGLSLGLLGALAVAQAVFAQKESSAAHATLPDLKPSKDWRALEITASQGMAARAWSDAAAGCHLALFAVPIPDTAGRGKIIESLSATLAKSDYQLTETEDAQERTRLVLEGFGVTGFATLHVPAGEMRQATLLACYWNDREPAHCKLMCDAAAQRISDMKSTSDEQRQP